MEKQRQKMIFKAKKNYQRIDVFLSEVQNVFTRADIQRLIKEGMVLLNNKSVSKKSLAIESNDRVQINQKLKTNKIPEYIPSQEFQKLYEDEDILIINKPRGFSVHPGASKYEEETILDIFKYHYPQIIDNSERPGIVHRLDKDTTGVLILAKNNTAKSDFQKMFKNRELKKNYLAIVHGRLRFLKGKIENSLVRSKKYRTKYIITKNNEENSRKSLTYYQLLFFHSNFSFVNLSPVTGRTHQLRIHMKSIGHNILGDSKYGKQHDKFPYLALHAYSIEFFHPYLKKNVFVHSPFPKELKSILK